MEKGFLLIAALFVSAITVSAQPAKTEEKPDADPEKVLVYGVTSGALIPLSLYRWIHGLRLQF